MMKKKKPLWMIFTADALLICVCLCVFALFHHVLPRAKEAVADSGVIVQNDTADQADTETTSSEGSWAKKFADKFSDNVKKTNSSYKSSDISIEVAKKTKGSGSDKVTYYVADIYVADINCFRTALAGNTYGTGFRSTILDMDKENNALLAINGDYYGNSNEGVVIRNGKLYRDSYGDNDICVIYKNGVMKTYSGPEFDADKAIEEGAWQAWTFGPSLIDYSGDSNSSSSGHGMMGHGRMESENPRSAIGYYEPGHYCLVVIDGRNEGYSKGMTFEEMSALFKGMGCKAAYNLDGGKSSEMTFNDSIVNQPDSGGRSSSDCILIKEME